MHACILLQTLRVSLTLKRRFPKCSAARNGAAEPPAWSHRSGGTLKAEHPKALLKILTAVSGPEPFSSNFDGMWQCKMHQYLPYELQEFTCARIV